MGGPFTPSKATAPKSTPLLYSLHFPNPIVLQGFQYSFLRLSRDIRDLILQLIGLLSTMVYRDFCYRLKGLFFLRIYRVSNPTVFLYCIISGSHQQFIGFLTTNKKALFLPRVLYPPHVYNLIGFPFFSRTISGEIQCSSQEREAPGLQTHFTGQLRGGSSCGEGGLRPL